MTQYKQSAGRLARRRNRSPMSSCEASLLAQRRAAWLSRAAADIAQSGSARAAPEFSGLATGPARNGALRCLISSPARRPKVPKRTVVMLQDRAPRWGELIHLKSRDDVLERDDLIASARDTSPLNRGLLIRALVLRGERLDGDQPRRLDHPS
jgi:hypothetical protein